jgi:hypothetical protein
VPPRSRQTFDACDHVVGTAGRRCSRAHDAPPPRRI